VNLTIVPAAWAPYLLSVLRMVAALEFLQHGTAKYLKFPIVPAYAQFTPLSPAGVAGVFELVGSLFLLFGLFSRVAAFFMSGVMAVGYFMVHFPRGFFPILNGGELAVLYCFVFLYLAAAGPGPWSIDAAWRK
jgi:putative oxidoreductase